MSCDKLLLVALVASVEIRKVMHGVWTMQSTSANVSAYSADDLRGVAPL